MLRFKILENLEQGNYEVKLESECHCRFMWALDMRWLLPVCEVRERGCWQGWVLYIGEELIGIRFNYKTLDEEYQWEFFENAVTEADIPEKIWREMMQEFPSLHGEAHSEARYESFDMTRWWNE